MGLSANVLWANFDWYDLYMEMSLEIQIDKDGVVLDGTSLSIIMDCPKPVNQETVNIGMMYFLMLFLHNNKQN